MATCNTCEIMIINESSRVLNNYMIHKHFQLPQFFEMYTNISQKTYFLITFKTSNGERSVVKLLIEIGFPKMKRRRSLQLRSIFSQLRKGTKTTRQNKNVILDVQQI